MKNVKILVMIALVIFSLIATGNNEYNPQKMRKKKVARMTQLLHQAAQDCPVMSYLENNREKLSPEEMKAYNTFKAMYNESMFDDVYSMTVSDYLHVVRSTNNEGMTIQEIADRGTTKSRFGFVNDDACYRLARGMEYHEHAFSGYKAQGKSDHIIRYVPDLAKELKG